MYRIDLGFAQIRCIRCAATRIRGVSCWHCGALPDEREVDPDKARRRRLAEKLISTLKTSDGLPTADVPLRSPEQVFEVLAEWIETFMRALVRAVESKEGETDLAAAIDALVVARRRIRGAIRLRPWLLVWRGLDDLLAHIEDVTDSFLRAIEATTPIEGQRSARLGQEALDTAGDEVAELGRRVAAYAERAGLLEDGGLPALIGEIAGPIGGNILELDASGAPLYQRLTGEHDCPQGLGIGLRLTGLQAELLMDPDHFWDIALEYTHALLSRRDRLMALIQDDDWRKDMQDAARRMQDAGLAHAALLGGARHDRHRVHAALSLVHAMTEGPIRRYGATLLTVSGGLPYPRQRLADLGAVMQRLRQAGFGSLADGVDIALRGAKAHEEYEVTDEGGLILNRNGVLTTIASDELLDRFLACLEVALALSTSIAVAAAAVGTDAEGVSELLPLDLSTEDAVSMATALSGWTDVNVAIEERAVSVSGVVESVQASHVAPLLAHLPDNVETIRLVGSTPAGEVTLTSDLGPWRRWRVATDENNKTIAFVEAMANCHIGEETGFSRAQVRTWSARFAVQIAGGDLNLQTKVAHLRELRAMAARIRDQALADSVTDVIAATRAREIGLPSQGLAPSTVKLLQEWVDADIAFPLASIGPRQQPTWLLAALLNRDQPAAR